MPSCWKCAPTLVRGMHGRGKIRGIFALKAVSPSQPRIHSCRRLFPDPADLSSRARCLLSCISRGWGSAPPDPKHSRYVNERCWVAIRENDPRILLRVDADVTNLCRRYPAPFSTENRHNTNATVDSFDYSASTLVRNLRGSVNGSLSASLGSDGNCSRTENP